MCMIPPAGQESEDSSQSMDLCQTEEKPTCDGKLEDCVLNPNDELADVQVSSQKIDVLPTSARIVTEESTPKSEEILPSIRVGGNGSGPGQENNYKSIREGENVGVQPSIPNRRTKMPLAEQGAAFQAALQHAKEAPQSINGGEGKGKKWSKEMKNQATAAAAESPRIAALKKQREKEKRARRKEKRRQQRSETEMG